MRGLIDRPVAAAMACAGVLAFGLFSLLNTPVELAPGGRYPRLDIEASWPGAMPEEVQSRLAAPLEEALAAVKGVRGLSSEARKGGASIGVDVDPGRRAERVEAAVREALRRARPGLPFAAKINLRPFLPGDLRAGPLLSLSVFGPYSPGELLALVRDRIALGLGSVDGISSVDAAGGAEPEVRVILQEQRLRALGLDALEVEQALSQALVRRPGGRVRSAGREHLLDLSMRVRGLDDLGRVVVGFAGRTPVRLSDIAEIRQSEGEGGSLVRIDGLPALFVTVTRRSGTGALGLARMARREVAGLSRRLPPDIGFRIEADEGAEIGKALRRLGGLAAAIVTLVFAMVFATLRRLLPSLLVLSSAAAAGLVTFAILYPLGVALDLMSLGALALGFGMFVDNAIIVFESAERHRERGSDPVKAAMDGASEVVVPVLASTLTTAGVFILFPFFQGRVREFYLPLAFVMTAALSASLVVAFTIVPAASVRLLAGSGPTPPRRLGLGALDRVLGSALRHPWTVLAGAGALLGISFGWFRAKVPVGEFFRWPVEERLEVALMPSPGSGRGTADLLVRGFEETALKSGPGTDTRVRVFDDAAMLSVGFEREAARSARPYLLKEEFIRLAAGLAGVSVDIRGFGPQGYSAGGEAEPFWDSRLRLLGYDLKRLREIGLGLERTLRREPRVRGIRTSSSGSFWMAGEEAEFVLRPDRLRSRAAGVDQDRLRSHLRSLTGASIGLPLRGSIDGRERTIRIVVPEAGSIDLRHILGSVIPSPSSPPLRVADVMTSEERAASGPIERRDRRFQRTVLWEFRGPLRAAEAFRDSVLASLVLPAGFSAEVPDEGRMSASERGQIGLAGAAGITVLFIILAALLESPVRALIVLVAIPLSLIGVFSAFVLSGMPFDPSAHVGVLLMSGLVVNNAVLVVDAIDRKRRRGGDLVEAVVAGTKDRLRPIIMTTGTTLLGMAPLLPSPWSGARVDIWSSLALCTAGGLASSTPLVLLVVPVVYRLVEGRRKGPGLGRDKR